MGAIRTGVIAVCLTTALALGLVGMLDVVAAARSAHFNADLLYVADLARDVLERPGAIGGWRLPPAPYFFPDLALFIIARAATSDLRDAYLLYGVAISLLLGAAFYVLFRESGVGRGRAAIAVGLAGAFFVACMRGAPITLLVVFLPIFHAGAVLSGVVTLAATARLLRRGVTRAGAGFLFAVATLTTLSDMLYVVQFLLPLVGALLWGVRAGWLPRTASRRIAILLACAPIAAATVLRVVLCFAPWRFSDNFVNTAIAETRVLTVCALAAATGIAATWAWASWAVRDATPGGAHRPWKRAALVVAAAGALLAVTLAVVALSSPQLRSAILRQMPRLPAGWPLAGVRRWAGDGVALAAQVPLLAATTLASIVGSVAIAWRSRAAAGPVRLVAAFFSISAPALLVIGALTWTTLGTVVPPLGAYREGTPRHLQPLYVLPPFFVALAIARGGLPRRALVAATAAVMLVIAGRLAPVLVAIVPARLAVPDDTMVRCLDGLATARHFHSGYGDYWTGRHLSMASRVGVEVVPLRLRTFEIEDWCANPLGLAARTHRPGTGEARFDFFVTSRFRTDEVTQRFGPPVATEHCGAMEVLVYDPPLPDLLRETWRAMK